MCVCVWLFERKRRREKRRLDKLVCLFLLGMAKMWVDMAMTCMTLEKDVLIVSHPSPRGHWLVESCKGRTAQKLSICTLPRCWAFPYRVSAVTLTSSTCTQPPTEVQIPPLTFLFSQARATAWCRSYNKGNSILQDENPSFKQVMDESWMPRNCNWFTVTS